METIVGTAGHIDHGKTALVKALTGTDTDRLPEEKLRGITVDLGFAEMTIGGDHFGFVDVPGHEKFVKNMLTGASGIDIVMLVISADEGVMPQTREHFDICRLLGVKAGIIALTKTDLVDDETLELAKLDAADLVAGSFLENTPVVAVSSQIGEGISELKESLIQTARQIPVRVNRFITRLPIDRSFSMKGFGAVVTGTLVSGGINEGDELELFPYSKRVRVRGLQTHGRSVKTVNSGQRTAVNLGGIDYTEIDRGMTLAEPDTLRLTQIIDVVAEVLANTAKPLRSRQRVHLHIGTAEILARIYILNDANEVAAGESGYAQIRLEMPVIAVPGERFIIRSYSPQVTIAGGIVIDTFATKHRRKEFADVCRHLTNLIDSNGNDAKTVNLLLDAAGKYGLSFADLQARTGLRSEILRSAIAVNTASKACIDASGIYINSDVFAELSSSTQTAIQTFHKREPLSKGISREALRETVFSYVSDEVFRTVLSSLETTGLIVSNNETIRLSAHKTDLSPAETEFTDKIRSIYSTAGLNVPKLDEVLANSQFTPQHARKLFQTFIDTGEIVKVSEEFYFERTVIERLINMVREYASTIADRTIDVAKFKDLAGVSRKYAIPLIEYFDRQKITQRVGEKRIILK